MAKCKICNTDIEDGSMYCKDCLEKEQLKSKESYLDSLLSSVMKNTQPNKPSMRNQKNTDRKKQSTIDTEEQKDSVVGEQIAIDLKEQRTIDTKEQNSNGVEEHKIIDTEEQKNIDRKEPKKSGMKEQNMEQVEASVVDEYLQAFNSDASDDLHDFEQFNIMDDLENADGFMNFANQKNSDDRIVIHEEDLFGDLKDTEPDSNIIPNEIDNFSEEDPEDPTLYAILNELDQSNSDKKEEKSFDKAAQSEQDKKEETVDDEILSLLNQMSVDDPVAMEISNLLNGTNDPVPSVDNTSPSDVGEVFSDALTAVSSLNDKDSNVEQSSIEKEMDEKKKGKKEKFQKLLVQPENEQDHEAKEPEKKKDGLFARIFDKNSDKKVKKEKKSKKVKKVKEIAPGTEEKEEVFKAGNPVKGKTSDGKAAKKAAKKSAKKKTKAPLAKQEEERENSESFGKKNAGKKVSKKESIKQKKASKKKPKEVKKVVNEVEVDHGHINLVAASFVMITFALLTALLISGTKAFAYSNSIKNATYYFSTHKYTQAYDEVDGMDMKDEDAEIYNKIQTVMYVNKQLNSYNNFYAVEKYPEALDSLLKGLKRYDKYIELATLYGIESDLDYVRDQILAELKNKFDLSEEEAMQITFIENESEYSKRIYDIITA
ncbi:MAG: hypothetical protein E7255_16360 [Lachnospiraceae bacterium]|nr:hypothetical protein [Lachnospiraceae bacterium]